MAVKNKFVLEAEEVDQQWANFKAAITEATEEQSQKHQFEKKNPRQMGKVCKRSFRRPQKGLKCDEAQFGWSTYHER